jgi:RNA polymerase sigma factor (TIGR02999 family)
MGAGRDKHLHDFRNSGDTTSPDPPFTPGTPADPHDSDEDIFAAAYNMLRGRARRLIAAEAVGHTLQPTALVHEAYLRLAGTDNDGWQSRAHFLAVASRAMRRVLIDHARTRSRQKRGRGWSRVTLHDDLGYEASGRTIDLLDIIQLDRSLQDLEREHERMGRVAEMRLFGGMAMEEIAANLGVSVRTIEGDWAFVRRWLAAAMAPDDGGGRP